MNILKIQLDDLRDVVAHEIQLDCIKRGNYTGTITYQKDEYDIERMWDNILEEFAPEDKINENRHTYNHQY